MWMDKYIPSELGVTLEREPKDYLIGTKTFHVGHGDGLGPGDQTYKILKKIFANKACQWLFHWLHPNIGMGIARAWSGHSRAHNDEAEAGFQPDKEWILLYCREMQQRVHKDFYVFGHRHLPIDYDLGNGSRYINLGEWVTQYRYGVFDGVHFELKHFQ
jgi:UDP-2,3-diacylglucosamine hydrolase